MTRATGPQHTVLMLALTFSTGVVDAVGYLGLDRVFTGNMTGNVAILGMALAGGDGLPVAGPVVALAGFALGAAVAGRSLRREESGWSTRTSVLLGVVALVMSGLVVALAVVGADPVTAVAITVTGLLGAAMGLQAGTARHLAVKDVTTVVITSAITGLFADSALGNGAGSAWRRRGMAVVLLLVGALVGALLLRWSTAAGLGAATVVVLAVAVVGHVDLRRSGRATATAKGALA